MYIDFVFFRLLLLPMEKDLPKALKRLYRLNNKKVLNRKTRYVDVS